MNHPKTNCKTVVAVTFKAKNHPPPPHKGHIGSLKQRLILGLMLLVIFSPHFYLFYLPKYVSSGVQGLNIEMVLNISFLDVRSGNKDKWWKLKIFCLFVMIHFLKATKQLSWKKITLIFIISVHDTKSTNLKTIFIFRLSTPKVLNWIFVMKIAMWLWRNLR